MRFLGLSTKAVNCLRALLPTKALIVILAIVVIDIIINVINSIIISQQGPVNVPFTTEVLKGLKYQRLSYISAIMSQVLMV